MISEPEFNFLFVAITKTGSSTIIQNLRQSGMAKAVNKDLYYSDIPWSHPQHNSALEWKQVLGEEDFNNRFKFAFVRNPWGHLLSHFTFICRSKHARSLWGLTLNDITNPDKFNEWAVNVLSNRIVEKCSRKRPLCEHQRIIHWPCKDWITDANGKIIVDFVGRHENFDEDYKKARSLIAENAACPMPKVRELKVMHTSNAGYGYEHYYSDEAKGLVRDHFRKDIEEFGYEF